MLNGAGGLAKMLSDHASARAYFEESLNIWKEIGDRRGIATSHNNLGEVARSQGDYASARAYHEESLTIYWEIGEQRGVAYSLEAFASLADKASKR